MPTSRQQRSKPAVAASLTPEELGEAIAQRLAELGESQTWLAFQVATICEERPVSQPMARRWLLNPSILSPARVFAVEKALGVKPGSYSRHLGFLPLDVVPFTDVLSAIEHDAELDALAKVLIGTVYRSAVDQLRERRQKRQRRT